MDEMELAVRLSAAEQSVKSAHKRLDELHELTNSVAGMVNELKHMREDVNRLSMELAAVRDRPAQRYELAARAVITTLIGGMLGYLLNLML